MGSVPVPFGTRRVSKTSVVWVSLSAAWPSFATFLNGRVRASVARRTSCGEPHAGYADVMCRTDSRRSSSRHWWRKTSVIPTGCGMTSVTDVAEVTGGSGTGRSASRGGCDPRDAEVRALRKHLAELQRKTSRVSSALVEEERDGALQARPVKKPATGCGVTSVVPGQDLPPMPKTRVPYAENLSDTATDPDCKPVVAQPVRRRRCWPSSHEPTGGTPQSVQDLPFSNAIAQTPIRWSIEACQLWKLMQQDAQQGIPRGVIACRAMEMLRSLAERVRRR